MEGAVFRDQCGADLQGYGGNGKIEVGLGDPLTAEAGFRSPKPASRHPTKRLEAHLGGQSANPEQVLLNPDRFFCTVFKLRKDRGAEHGLLRFQLVELP